MKKKIANFVGSKYAVAVNNGTAALHLAIIASSVEEGDEVLIPDITFASTAKVILYQKAIPVLVECEPNTFNISLSDAEKKITKKTKAIISVDMNGMPVDYDKIIKFSKKFKLQFISDSAESLGSTYKNKKIGSIAPIHIFSFFPNKNITTGEGGVITLSNLKKYKLIKMLRNMGQSSRYHHKILGYNYRMTDIAATIGIIQLKKINKILKDKEIIAKKYNKLFKNTSIQTPFIPSYVTQHAWYSYTIKFKKTNRDKLRSKLDKLGIETRVSFPNLHNQPFIKQYLNQKQNKLKNSRKIWKSLINIPIWSGLSSKKINFIANSIINEIKK